MALYEHLIGLIGNRSCSPETVRELVEHYKEVIHSRRRCDQIHNLRDLVAILERRDVLNETSQHDVLAEIARIVRRREPAVPVPLAVAVPRGNANKRAAPVLRRRPTDRVDYVHDTIASELGCFWPDFARKLGVSESEIDQLYATYGADYPTIILEVLTFHKDTFQDDEHRWACDLMSALENARRVDLRNKLQRYLLRSG